MDVISECCIACLSDNKNSFAGFNEKEELEKFLGEKLPPVFANIPVILCNGCMFQLERFQNFRQSVQNSINTIERQLNKIYKCRVFVEPLEMVVESMSNVIKEEQPEIEMCDVDEPPQDNDIESMEVDDDESQSMPDFGDSVSPTDSDSSFDVPLKRSKQSKRLKKSSPTTDLNERKRRNKRLEAIKGKYKIIKPIASRKPREPADLYCSICKITVNQPPFMAHCKSVHLTELENGLYYCKICEQQFKSETSGGLYNHIDSHREFRRPKKCGECDETFTIIAEWRKHFTKHNIPVYQCLCCPAKFKTVLSLYPHIMEQHTDALFCRFCSKTFKKKEDLDKHLIEERRNYNALRRVKYKNLRGESFKKKLGRKVKYRGSAEDTEESQPELTNDVDDSQPTIEESQSSLGIEQETISDTFIKTEAALELTADYDYSLDQWDANYIEPEQFIEENDNEILVNGKKIEYTVERSGGRTRVFTKSKGKTTKWHEYINKYKDRLPSRKLESKKRSCKKLDTDCSICGIKKLTGFRSHVLSKHAIVQDGRHFCGECNLECSSHQSLVYHFDLHRTFPQPKQCNEPGCTDILENMKDYKRHMEAHKFSKKEHKCPECDNTYCRIASLQFHYMIIHTGALMCRFCEMVFELKEDYDLHLKAETLARKEKKRLIRYTQIRLAREKEREEKLKQGIKMEEEEGNAGDPDEIDDLPMVFSRQITRVNGRKRTKSIIPKSTRSTQKTYCHICKIYSNNFKNHVTENHATKLDTGGYSCNICHSCLKDNYSVHFYQMHREYPTVQNCSDCDFSSIRYEIMRKHLITHTRGLFECHYCGSSYTEKTSLRYHMFFKHTNLFICNFCNKTFEEESLFKEHKAEEKAKRKGKAKVCDICGFTTIHPTYMKGHMTRVHGDSRTDSVICNICNKKVKSVLNLKDHMLNVHGKKNEVCPQCGKRFRNQAYLREHIKNSHSTIISKCEFCEKVGTPIQLKRHVYMCHDTTRPWVCKICHMTFKIKAGLQKHLHTHAGTRPFNCHLCAQGFYNREVVEKHLNEVHKINYTREEIRQFIKRMPSKYEKEHLKGDDDAND